MRNSAYSGLWILKVDEESCPEAVRCSCPNAVHVSSDGYLFIINPHVVPVMGDRDMAHESRNRRRCVLRICLLFHFLRCTTTPSGVGNWKFRAMGRCSCEDTRSTDASDWFQPCSQAAPPFRKVSFGLPTSWVSTDHLGQCDDDSWPWFPSPSLCMYGCVWKIGELD
jgi:hypothetical protein